MAPQKAPQQDDKVFLFFPKIWVGRGQKLEAIRLTRYCTHIFFGKGTRVI